MTRMFTPHRLQRSPRLFTRNPAGTLRTLLLITACILLMFYDHQRGRLAKVHAALSTVVYPIQAAVNAPYALVNWAGEQLAAHSALVRENADMQRQLLADSAQLQQLAALEQENTRLRALLQAGARVEGHVMAATLLAVDMDPYRHVITIDKGTRAGVFDGQTLLDAHGIIGQVIRTDPWSSEAALITDPNQAIPVQINRTGLRTLAIGTADVDTLSLPYLANNANVQAGDLLVTSGLGGGYPPGYPVAIITRVQHNPAQPFASVSAKPVAELDRGHTVLLFFPTVAPPSPPQPQTPALKKPLGKNPR
jgi:rod shape-determining protein MreC